MARQAQEDREGSKRAKVSQSEFPNVTLVQALRIARAIWDNFAGKGAAPHQVAMAIDLSPTSGGWRNLCGSSIAYGLTEGGYAASEITLTDLGRRIVAPADEGGDTRAMVEALLRPRIQKEFLEKYNRAKFPPDKIAKNVLVQMGLPKERADSAFEILVANGRAAGVIQETKTGPFIAVDTPKRFPVDPVAESESRNSCGLQNGHENPPIQAEAAPIGSFKQFETKANNRVFITHGKNKKILEQIKKLVTLGGFEPVIAVERETAALPVPAKVMDEMRSCGAAVIHVGAEGKLKDGDGKEHTQINPNVLIEIGAAMGLYRGNRFILVVEEGVKLPSNLQGLYECRYSGDGLDMDAGMKILEALRGLK